VYESRGGSGVDRDVLEAAIKSVLRPYATRHEETFAGLYLVERPAMPVVYMGFTGRVGYHHRNLSRLFPFPDQLEPFSARYAIRELEEVQERIVRDLDDIERTRHVDITSVGVSERCNAVTVRLAQPSEGVGEALQRRYGMMVRVDRQPFAPKLR
jgi:hypothetical protein